MKRSRILLSFSFVIILSVGCAEEWIPTNERIVWESANIINLTKAEERVTASQCDFALSVFKDLYSAASEDENIVFSPFSVSTAFSVLGYGASGKTRQQIINGLGFRGMDYADIASYYKKMLSAFSSAGDSVCVTVANSVWGTTDQQFHFKDDFISEIKRTYEAESHYISFKDVDIAAKTVNDWAFEKTLGRIADLIHAERLRGATVLTMNAMTIDAKWMSGPYHKKSLRFNALNGNFQDTDFFTNDYPRDIISYFDNKVSVVKIPFGNGSLSLMIVLPDDSVDFNSFISSLSSEKWNKWSSGARYHMVLFNVPVYSDSFASDESLMTAIKNRGIVVPFEIGAQFTNLSDDYVPPVSYMVQKTVIDISETGASAAAATAIIQGAISPGPDSPKPEYHLFNADHPFVYAVEETSTGTLLFIGTHVK